MRFTWGVGCRMQSLGIHLGSQSLFSSERSVRGTRVYPELSLFIGNRDGFRERDAYGCSGVRKKRLGHACHSSDSTGGNTSKSSSSDGDHHRGVSKEEEVAIAMMMASTDNNTSNKGNSNTSKKEKTRRTKRKQTRNTATADDNSNHSEQQQPKSVQGMVIHRLIELNEFDEDMLDQVPTHTLNWIVKVLGKYKRPDVSEQVFHWMRLKGKANEHSLIKLFEGLELAGCSPARSVRAWRNVCRMQCPFTPGYKSTAALLKTFRPRKDVDGALRILKEIKMRKLPLNEYAYNTVIRIAADVGDVDTAMRLEKELREDGQCRSDVRTYSSLMHALSASGKWSQTRVVEGLLRSADLRPDATLALQLMSGYARGGWPAAAEAVMDEFMDRGGVEKPNRSHWNALLYAYATARQYPGCLMAYQRMTSKVGIRPDSYTMVALLKAGRRSQAGRTAVTFVLSQMEEYSVPFTVELVSSAIACCRTIPFVSRQEAENSRDLANHVWSLMVKSEIRPNRVTYNTLFAARADAGDSEGVKELFAQMEGDDGVYPDDSTYHHMARVYEAQGNWKELENVTALRDTWKTLHDV